MISIHCKIIIVQHTFVCFFANNYNVGELTSIAFKERMTTSIVFVFATVYCHTHQLTENLYASKLYIFLCSPCYTAWQRGKSMKSTSSCHYENTKDSLMTVCALYDWWAAWMDHYQWWMYWDFERGFHLWQNGSPEDQKKKKAITSFLWTISHVSLDLELLKPQSINQGNFCSSHFGKRTLSKGGLTETIAILV